MGSRPEAISSGAQTRHSTDAPKPLRRNRVSVIKWLPSTPVNGLSRGGYSMFRLTPPKQITFLISVAVAVIAVILHYANIPIPGVTQSNFVTLLIGYVVLVAGNLLDGV